MVMTPLRLFIRKFNFTHFYIIYFHRYLLYQSFKIIVLILSEINLFTTITFYPKPYNNRTESCPFHKMILENQGLQLPLLTLLILFCSLTDIFDGNVVHTFKQFENALLSHF